MKKHKQINPEGMGSILWPYLMKFNKKQIYIGLSNRLHNKLYRYSRVVPLLVNELSNNQSIVNRIVNGFHL